MDPQALLLPLLIVLVGGMLFFGSRRQRKAVAQQQQLQTSLTVGDRVMTTSGLFGTVASVDSETNIDIEIAPGVVTTWLRAAVREKVNPTVDSDVVETEDEEQVAGEPASNAEIAPPLESKTKG
ncbi:MULTISPECIES: preprotein translocase subunit YajC [unclassified Kutzneria]|uniref:preprotein translocase subunit YajC n=1 Tax=unclassified Kutzneria TaxID=2621979 RepID=UPI0003EEC637|nr:preprotein translocase subunit YajC [Kutzneria sp. 744]EWM11829.1 preprotein translocase YajC subunit [Kutzneria sp. 744]